MKVTSCSGIYLIRNRLNGKCYVGSSCAIDSRIKVHLKGKGSRVLSAAIRKYGIENFETFVLEKASREKLPSKEGKWIAKLKPKYNLTIITKTGGRIVSPESIAKTLAGKVGYKHSEETKQKIGEANRGRKFSKEQRSRMSEGQLKSEKAKINIVKLIEMHRGKKISPELVAHRVVGLRKWKPTEAHRQAARDRNLGKKMSPEACEKMRLAKLGKKHSPEHCAKIAAAGTGRKHKPESIQKMVAAQAISQAIWRTRKFGKVWP